MRRTWRILQILALGLAIYLVLPKYLFHPLRWDFGETETFADRLADQHRYAEGRRVMYEFLQSLELHASKNEIERDVADFFRAEGRAWVEWAERRELGRAPDREVVSASLQKERRANADRLRTIREDALLATLEGELASEPDPWRARELILGVRRSEARASDRLAGFLRSELAKTAEQIEKWERRAGPANDLLGRGDVEAAETAIADLASDRAPPTLLENLRSVSEIIASWTRRLERAPDDWVRREELDAGLRALSVRSGPVSNYLQNERDRAAAAIARWDREAEVLRKSLVNGDVAAVSDFLADLESRGAPAGMLSRLRAEHTAIRDMVAELETAGEVYERRRLLVGLRSRARDPTSIRAEFLTREERNVAGVIAKLEADASRLRSVLYAGDIARARARCTRMEDEGAPATLIGELEDEIRHVAAVIRAIEEELDPWERRKIARTRIRGPDDGLTGYLTNIERECDVEIESWERKVSEVDKLLAADDTDAARDRLTEIRNLPETLRRRYRERLPPEPDVPHLSWAYVPEGTYWVGTPTPTGDGDIPPTQVSVTGYLITRNEVPMSLLAEYLRDKRWPRNPVTGENVYSGDNLPAYGVTFDEAKQFCVALTRAFPEFVFTLPDEVEWEIAARGRPSDKADLWPIAGPDPEDLDKLRAGIIANREELDLMLQRYANFVRNSGSVLAQRASKQANSIGMFDVQGNVAEWVLINKEIYGPRPEIRFGWEPTRGGSLLNGLDGCRPGHRAWEPADDPAPQLGFRVICRPRT